jgi:hypothetical protein
MGRLSAVITAASLLALATPAGAAEITRIATAAEPDNAFDLDLSMRWERTQKKATITREKATALTPADPFGRVDDVPELSFSEVTNVIIPRVAAGLYQDLELHLELPYYLGQDVAWKYASGITTADQSAISSNTIDANGLACTPIPPATTCPLFAAGPKDTTVYHGGVAGDLKVGLAWGIFSDVKDETKPFWLVGFDITFPTSSLYDPWAGRVQSNNYLSPSAVPAHVAGVGQKIWKFDLQTALSKRMGPIDPYFKVHLTLPRRFSSTYSNCDHVADAAPGTPPGTSVAATNCALPQWKDAAGAQLPWNAGLIFGTEFIPLEDRVEGQRMVIDVRVTAEYTSKARWYNELTDATGKLLQTESYMQMGGLLSFLFRASSYVAVQGEAAYAWETSHLLTGEPLGVADGTNSSPDQNPNFDWRWDAPGRRFRITSAGIFSLKLAGILTF